MRPDALADQQGIVAWDAVLSQFNGRQEFVVKLTGIAMQAYADLPEKLARTVSEHDLQGLGFLAHRIKGICANLHAPRVLALALETEKHARDGNAARALPLGEELATLVRAMIDDIAAWQKANPGSR